MSRQRAKTRQEVEGSRLNYLELWREEFSAQVQTWRGSGHQLQVNSILKGTVDVTCAPVRILPYLF